MRVFSDFSNASVAIITGTFIGCGGGADSAAAAATIASDVSIEIGGSLPDGAAASTAAGSSKAAAAAAVASTTSTTGLSMSFFSDIGFFALPSAVRLIGV